MTTDSDLVLVTGGTGTLGSAVARAFLGCGARVAVTYRSDDKYAQLVATVSVSHARLAGYPVDAGDVAGLKSLVERLTADGSRLDVLVNTVGGYAGGAKLWETDGSTLARMLALNLMSGYNAARAVLPVMLKQGRGSIINIAARAAIDPPGGAAEYAASKAAALALMQSLSADVVGSGVRVNTILPRIVDSEENRKALPKADHAKWTKAADIASLIVSLCGPGAMTMNGAAIPV
jgi:NAD(P)-dependent dehydrogenase (short-subunit alcohol dehydrogenase family)